MKRSSRYLFACAISIALANVIATPAEAGQTCKTATRDRSNLTVYNAPNGESVNELLFGREVTIQDSSRDQQGQTWVKIASNYNGEYRRWGWVPKKYLDCGNQARSTQGKKIVTVYGKMNCPWTAKMIQQLAQNGVPYLFKDTTYSNNAQEMDQRFQRANLTKDRGHIPLVYINKNQWTRVGPGADTVIAEYRSNR